MTETRKEYYTKRGQGSSQPKCKKSIGPDGATNEMLTHLDKSAI